MILLIIKSEFVELLDYFGFEAVAFGELGGEGLFVVCHARVEFVGCNVDIVDFDVEVLSCRERVAFLFYLVVRDYDREVVDGLAIEEGRDDSFDFGIIEAHLFETVGVFVFLAEFASVDKYDLVGRARFVEK